MFPYNSLIDGERKRPPASPPPPKRKRKRKNFIGEK